jgi:hypothetical protein
VPTVCYSLPTNWIPCNEHRGPPEPHPIRQFTPLITLVDDDFISMLSTLCVVAILTIGCCLSFGAIMAADYFISAESTVNAINAQCGTQYQKLDYLRIGQTAMLQMCETRQKRVELR